MADTSIQAIASGESDRRQGASAEPRSSVILAWTSSSRTVHAVAVLLAIGVGLTATQPDVPVAAAAGVLMVVPAALVDLHQHRLPNVLVAFAALVFVVACGLESMFGGNIDVGDATLGAGVMAAPLLALHVLAPSSMGFGDVKASLVLGAALGLVDMQLPLVALAIASALTASVGLVRRLRHIAFGPGLVLGSAIALLIGFPTTEIGDSGQQHVSIIDPSAPPTVDTPRDLSP